MRLERRRKVRQLEIVQIDYLWGEVGDVTKAVADASGE